MAQTCLRAAEKFTQLASHSLCCVCLVSAMHKHMPQPNIILWNYLLGDQIGCWRLHHPQIYKYCVHLEIRLWCCCCWCRGRCCQWCCAFFLSFRELYEPTRRRLLGPLAIEDNRYLCIASTNAYTVSTNKNNNNNAIGNRNRISRLDNHLVWY